MSFIIELENKSFKGKFREEENKIYSCSEVGKWQRLIYYC